MSEDGAQDRAAKETQRKRMYFRRKAAGQFLTKQLTVNEKQFKSLVAWGERNGVVIERFVGYGGYGTHGGRKKEAQDGQGS